MTRIRFQDLPSTNTPVDATDLDKLNNVVISSTEPNTGEEVWMQKGKNLFGGKLVLGSYTNTGAPDSQTTTQYRNENVVKVKPNTTYTTSINGTAQKYVMFYYDENMVFLSAGDNTTGTFTTPANCYYVNFRCYNADFTNDFASLLVQFEQGSTATTYEPYISKKIYTENIDEGYDEFYNSDKNAVAISSTEPSEGAVWLQKGKNLFNNNVETQNSYPNTSVGSKVEYYSSTVTTSYKKCTYLKAGTTYIISYKKNTPASTNGRISVIVNDADIILEPLYLWDNSESEIRFTPTTSGNLILAVDKNTTQIMIEEGSTATTFEPYIDKKIYTKNDNGVYEEFYDESEMNKETYSTAEIRIGTWIDGKPLYRKVFTGTFRGGTSTNTTVENILPLTCEIVKINGTTIQSSGNRRTLPFLIISSGTTYYISVMGAKNTSNNRWDLTFFYSQDYNTQNYEAILEYTKTTD